MSDQCTCPTPFTEDSLVCRACEDAEIARLDAANMALLGNPSDQEWAEYARRQG